MNYFPEPAVICIALIIALFITLAIVGLSGYRTAIRTEATTMKPKSVAKWLLEPETLCIEPFDTEFCLNGGRCLNFTMVDSFTPLCECADGFMGERCERKYLDQPYYQRKFNAVQNKSDGVPFKREKMTKKNEFSEEKPIAAKAAFKVAETKTKKKAKKVKSILEKLQANVKKQQKKSDKQLKDLHQDMVAKKPAPIKKPNKKNASLDVLRSVSQKLTKMQVN